MTLTAKQENFCQAIADGLNQSAAYRSAYSTENMADTTVNNNAYMLMQNSEITARIAELRAELSAVTLWKRVDSIKALIAVANGQNRPMDIIAAVKALNTMLGYDAPIKQAVSVSTRTLDSFYERFD